MCIVFQARGGCNAAARGCACDAEQRAGGDGAEEADVDRSRGHRHAPGRNALNDRRQRRD